MAVMNDDIVVLFYVQYGTTPLLWACRKGHADIVVMLLQAGAVVDKAGMVNSFLVPLSFGIAILSLYVTFT